MATIIIDNVAITLAQPLNKEFKWIGQRQPQRELAACWLTVHELDLPLTPRIIGVPGVGKTTLAAATAQERDQSVYIMQCTADTRPEDLIITPVLSSEGKISYHASPLLSAVLTGGVAVLDEGNRMSEKSWASLAGLLDHRRSVESIIAGIQISAHPEFRCVVTMNEDDSTFEIPDYIISRLQPRIKVGFPNREDELAILKYTIPFAPDELFELTVNFLQQGHEVELPYSIRDGLSIIRYALKQKKMDPEFQLPDLFHTAVKMVLGENVFDHIADESNHLGKTGKPAELRLGDFFFDVDDDDMNPDDLDIDYTGDAS